MRNSSLILALAVLGLFAWAGVGSISAEVRPDSPVTLGGAEWINDLEHARAASVETGKPILWFDMIGRLDENWC